MMINRRGIMAGILFVAIADLSVIILLSVLSAPKGTEKSLPDRKIPAAASLGGAWKTGGEKRSPARQDEAWDDPDKSKSDKTMLSIYQSLLAGNYRAEGGIRYNFLSDGSFSGYFDDKHRMVKDYSYEVVPTGGNTVVNIYNKGHSAMVSYYILLSDDTDIMLYYPEADFKVLLEE